MIMGRAFMQPARPKHTRHANPHLTGTNAWCGLTPPQPPRPRHASCQARAATTKPWAGPGRVWVGPAHKVGSLCALA